MWKRSSGQSISDFGRENNVGYSTIWRYINVKKMPVDEACAFAVKNRGRNIGHTKYWINDVSLRSYCAQRGIDSNRYYYRLSHKLTTITEVKNEVDKRSIRKISQS